MNEFGVLNNRKRALIALIHSVVFLGVAAHGFVAPKAGILGPRAAAGDVALIAIYMTVASILAWLVTLSRCGWERVYFALCTSSATCGLLRTVFGDASIPPAQYLRVVFLGSAVVLGILIFRSYSSLAQPEIVSE